MIRFVSFDLWLTLIKSNPEFKKERADYFAAGFNPRGLSSSAVFDLIREVDVQCDRENERTGGKIKAVEMYAAILDRLGHQPAFATPELLARVEEEMIALFYRNAPVYLHERVPGILEGLKRDGYRLNLSSNTGFIEGRFLHRRLAELNLAGYFDFAIFSDEISASKPSGRFFEEVWKKVDGSDKKEVLHIGDNYLADYQGAISFGFQALWLQEKESSYEYIRQKIDEKDREI